VRLAPVLFGSRGTFSRYSFVLGMIRARFVPISFSSAKRQGFTCIPLSFRSLLFFWSFLREVSFLDPDRFFFCRGRRFGRRPLFPFLERTSMGLRGGCGCLIGLRIGLIFPFFFLRCTLLVGSPFSAFRSRLRVGDIGCELC